jgi:excisionase family DNA binding protein
METESQSLLRVEEAAKYLSIGRTLVYRLLHSGELESVQIGRARRIPLVALESYVERLRDEADQSPRFTGIWD